MSTSNYLILRNCCLLKPNRVFPQREDSVAGILRDFKKKSPPLGFRQDSKDGFFIASIDVDPSEDIFNGLPNQEWPINRALKDLHDRVKSLVAELEHVVSLAPQGGAKVPLAEDEDLMKVSTGSLTWGEPPHVCVPPHFKSLMLTVKLMNGIRDISTGSRSYTQHQQQLVLEPCTVSDMPLLSGIWFAAFTDPALRVLWPDTPAVRAWWDASETSHFMYTYAFQKLIKVADPAAIGSTTGQPRITECAKWHLSLTPEHHGRRIGALGEMERERERQYLYMLATHPDYQRGEVDKGIVFTFVL
ncbi:hypothetical protein Micbo1qcDRAFT_180608 [Microdochium bolleyi]|uniref:N-acetyltransferase domain-containing protein n=1 Tax=Microdochium bolleyi TaxID=196109 RepID=A0A136IKX4_9PEZI|nr:hypothetical protein Micbo1qcDRAFT_180608 [Microdochium bolleyi]